MKTKKYRFVTHWEVPGKQEEVAELLNQPLLLPLWWPSVYLTVEKKAEAGQDRFYLFTKGWLPYTLNWNFRNTLKQLPDRLELEATGDLQGYGIWTFRQEGPKVKIQYEWEVDANKPILKYLSFIFKPIFSMNHHWAMKKGEESLRLELARLKSGLSRRDAPKPPMPTFGFRKYWRMNMEKQG